MALIIFQKKTIDERHVKKRKVEIWVYVLSHLCASKNGIDLMFECEENYI